MYVCYTGWYFEWLQIVRYIVLCFCEEFVQQFCEEIYNIYGLQHEKIDLIWASTWQNLSSGFSTNQDSNQSPHVQRQARKLEIGL